MCKDGEHVYFMCKWGYEIDIIISNKNGFMKWNEKCVLKCAPRNGYTQVKLYPTFSQAFPRSPVITENFFFQSRCSIEQNTLLEAW